MKYSVARVTTSLFYHFCAVKFTLIRSTGMARWSHLCREHFRVTSCQEVIPPSCVLYYEALSGYLNWVGISLVWISKPVVSCIEKKSMSHWHFTIVFALVFITVQLQLIFVLFVAISLSYVAISRTCHMSEFYLNKASICIDHLTCYQAEAWQA